MGIKQQNGFTIIEVMLFLGVTGLLAIGILVGSGIAIGQQRYRDSVNSLKSFLQEQYNQTTNVTNARSSAWTCHASTAVTEGATGEPRGTSDCVLLGRYVTVNETGTQMTASNVVGYRTTDAPPAASDIEEVQDNYQLGVSPIDQEEVEVSWGAQIVKPNTAGANPMPMSILIVRSPLSGSVMTFTAEGVKTNLKELITVENFQQRRDLCVNADAGTFVGRRMEVRIEPYAANQGAILIPPESESVCD